jgi:hypothetical protein
LPGTPRAYPVHVSSEAVQLCIRSKGTTTKWTPQTVNEKLWAKFAGDEATGLAVYTNIVTSVDSFTADWLDYWFARTCCFCCLLRRRQGHKCAHDSNLHEHVDNGIEATVVLALCSMMDTIILCMVAQKHKVYAHVIVGSMVFS